MVGMIKAGGTPAFPGKDCQPPSFLPFYPGHPLIPRITVQKLSLPICGINNLGIVPLSCNGNKIKRRSVTCRLYYVPNWR